VLDGKVYITSKSADTLQNKTDVSKAAMLVYSYVAGWHKVEKKVLVSGTEELQKLIEKMAKENGLDSSQPFVFRIEGKAKELNYHIIDWKDGEAHTMDNHKQFATAKKEKEQDVLLLGFYSDRHHSIFTHHSTNVHVHVLNKSNGTAGHLDNLELDGKITIYLSKQ
jgi:acetolactate decarboxylase